MNKNKYLQLKECFGKYGSFTTWNSNDITDISMFDDKFYKKINTSYIFVAMNPSKNVKQKFQCFHCRYKGGSDYKLAHALRGKFDNCYITDLWKSKIEPNSLNVIGKEPTKLDYKKLDKELELLRHPRIVAIGNDVYKRLNKRYNNVIKIVHYSARGEYSNKDYYKHSVLNALCQR